MCGSRPGVRTPPLRNHKNIGFQSNSGPDPLKLLSQHSMLGHHQRAFRWRADVGPLIVVFGSSHHSSTKVAPPLIKKKSGSAHETPSTTKVVCFCRLLKCLDISLTNIVNTVQTTHEGPD